MRMIDHMDMLEAAGKYRDEDYEKWLDERAEEWAILDDIETAERAYLTERYAGIDPQQESADELHDYLVDQKEEDDDF
jgi:hypothetical protein